MGGYTNREVYKVLNNGDLEFIAEVPTDGGALPNIGFIAYGQGYLWGTTMGSDKIYHIDPNGENNVVLFAGSSQGSMDRDIRKTTFNTPNGILFNEMEDTMYITDFGIKNLRIISDIVLSVNEQDEMNNSLKLVPNQARDTVRVRRVLENIGEYRIRISDPNGKNYKTISGSSDHLFFNIDIGHLSNGLYLISLSSGSRSMSKKLIKI